MQFGKLSFSPINERPELVAESTKKSIAQNQFSDVMVSQIDADLSDTAAFCDSYDIGMEKAANCVIVEARRGDRTWYAACMILATTRADVNGIVRRQLDARKISFAPMDAAVSLTSMEYGGITPIGLPAEWPILVDTQVAEMPQVIIGSGIRKSKLLVSGKVLVTLQNSTTLDIVKPE